MNFVRLTRQPIKRLLFKPRFGSTKAHDSHHENYEPAGYFLGDPGNKTKGPKYFWAPLYIWGYLGGTGVFLAAYALSPNKSPSQTAKIEAHRRLAESGETFGWPLPPNFQEK